MGKPSYSRTADYGLGESESRRAGEVVSQIMTGEEVSPDSIFHAGEVLANALWRGESSLLATAQDGLSILIGAIGGAEAQAQILGEVIAAGANGVPVFEKLAAREVGGNSPAGLKPAEMQAFRDSLSRPPQERLELITNLLQAESPAGQDVPEDGAPLGEAGRMKAALLRSRASAKNETADDGTPPFDSGPDGERMGTTTDELQTPDSKDPRAILLDKSFDPSLRVEAAMVMEGTALPDLATMLRGAKNEKEVAAVALARLGADPQMARQVRDQMKMLEYEPDIRRTAEYIRRGIEDMGDGRLGSERHLSDPASIGDGWLGRAIASCDRPGILCAAFGRERHAIPLALRQLALMRSTRQMQQK